MKKHLQYILIIIASIILPSFSFPSLAKDCPTIPETIKEVTVKNNNAILRAEPKKTSEKGSPISQGDKLKVIDRKPTQDSEGNDYCWYKVKFLKYSDAKQYWIVGIGLKEFSSWSVNLYIPSSPPTPTVPPNSPKNNEFLMSWLIWITLIFAGIGALSGLGGLVFIYRSNISQKRNLSHLRKLIDENNQQLCDRISLNINNQLSSYYKKTEARFESILDQITQLKEPYFLVTKTPSNYRLINEIIENFNHQNGDYFNDSRFVPFCLTQESSQGLVRADGYSIIQLKSFNDISTACYLKIELEGDNWLIPNITSPYFRQILRFLEEYPQIFSIATSGINKLTLIKPAKLKEVSSGLWGIAEIGEFET